MDIIDLTRSFIDWDEEGGRFKEWVRGMQLHATNHGWLDVPRFEIRWFIGRIRHIVSWIPFLWDDYDFGDYNIWLMQREKIRRLREVIGENKLAGDWEKQCREMKIAEDVLTRLIEDKYVSDEWEKHWKKFGHMEWKDLPHSGRISVRKENDEESGKDVKRMADREEYLKKQDLNFLGKHLAKHIRTWWD